MPENTVAILDDARALSQAIGDLYAYAVGGTLLKRRHSIVFRVVESRERDSINHQIKKLMGVENFLVSSEIFCPSIGVWHILDSEHIAHAHRRHSAGGEEKRDGHVPIIGSDFELIPELVQPRNIVELAKQGDNARVVYHAERSGTIFVVVEELRRRSGMTFKTLYKKKREGRGGHLAGE